MHIGISSLDWTAAFKSKRRKEVTQKKLYWHSSTFLSKPYLIKLPLSLRVERRQLEVKMNTEAQNIQKTNIKKNNLLFPRKRKTMPNKTEYVYMYVLAGRGGTLTQQRKAEQGK